MTNKKGKFFISGIIGAIIGTLGGLLFAPQSGQETRKDIALLAKKIADQIKSSASDTQKKVKEVFGEVTDSAKDTYRKIQSRLSSKVASVKTAGKQIDKEKYGQIVEEVISEFKDDLKATKDSAQKMASQLKKDWTKVKKALV